MINSTCFYIVLCILTSIHNIISKSIKEICNIMHYLKKTAWRNFLWPLIVMFKANFTYGLKLYTFDKLSSSIFCCLWVCQASVTPDQISTFSNIYRHTSPLLTLYHLISNSTNLYWSSTSQYRHILTQYHQVPLIINHPERHSSVNLKNSHFTTHLMSHA